MHVYMCIKHKHVSSFISALTDDSKSDWKGPWEDDSVTNVHSRQSGSCCELLYFNDACTFFVMGFWYFSVSAKSQSWLWCYQNKLWRLPLLTYRYKRWKSKSGGRSCPVSLFWYNFFRVVLFKICAYSSHTSHDMSALIHHLYVTYGMRLVDKLLECIFRISTSMQSKSSDVLYQLKSTFPELTREFMTVCRNVDFFRIDFLILECVK